MKLHVRVTDENGKVYEGDVQLAGTQSVKISSAPPKQSKADGQSSKPLDFTKPERAFVKTYSKGLSGPKKFVLMVAYLAKGKTGTEVTLSSVQSRWGKMTAHLGVFDFAHSGRAKDAGWVDTTKAGIYVLCSTWQDAIT